MKPTSIAMPPPQTQGRNEASNPPDRGVSQRVENIREDEQNSARAPSAREKRDPVQNDAREQHHHVEVEENTQPPPDPAKNGHERPQPWL